MKISVFILEDAAEISCALGDVLGEDPSLEIAAMCTTTTDALVHLRQQENDVYIVDIGFTEGSGIDFIVAVREQYPAAKVLAHSVYSNARLVWAAFKAGADGYILKDEVPNKVAEAIVALVNGGGFVSGQAAKILIDGVSRPPHQVAASLSIRGAHGMVNVGAGSSAAAPLAGASKGLPIQRPLLTPKELQVLEYVQLGFPAKRVAGALDISIFTVNQHIRSIYRKLNVRNKMEAVQAARATAASRSMASA